MNVSPILVTIKPTHLSVTSVLYGCTSMLFTYAELIGAGASRPRGNFQRVKIILRGRDGLAPIYTP